MVTEDYVSFETAKLLKKKGFGCNTNCYYIEDSDTKTLFYSPIRENHNAPIKNNELDVHINVSSGKMSAPTLQMAMKWLREVHQIDMWVERHNRKYKGYIHSEQRGDEALFYEDSYEQACEVAIKYCIENLI